MIPARIKSRYGDLFLIDHHPRESSPDTWVIALNSGLQCRTGPRRLYLNIARHLTDCGYGVTRVDLPGVGDSDGPTPPTHFDLHDPGNVRDIIEYVKTTHQPRNVLLLGLCAGARVAIKAAKLNPEVSGVIALSMPTITASPGSARSPEEPVDRISRTVAIDNVTRLKNIFRHGRLTDLDFLKRHLNPKKALTEFLYVARSISFLTLGRKKSHISQFISTLTRYTASNQRVLFLFGERDKIICDEFRELGLVLNPENVVIIPDGTHTFSTYSSHRQVILEAARWLQEEFPVGPAQG